MSKPFEFLPEDFYDTEENRLKHPEAVGEEPPVAMAIIANNLLKEWLDAAPTAQSDQKNKISPRFVWTLEEDREALKELRDEISKYLEEIKDE